MGASANTSDDMDAGPRQAPPGAEQPTRPSLAATGDRCSACGASLAADQRYCLACGERRGKARFRMAAAASPPTQAPAGARREQKHSRLSSGAALIAGIATLLLAMGVGVLIGRIHNSTPTPAAARSSPIQVITVGGSGAGGSAGTSTSAAAATAKAAQKKVASKPKTVVITKQLAARANAAASKVLGGTIKGPAVVTVGQPGSGPGYRNGHFTGQFFGP